MILSYEALQDGRLDTLNSKIRLLFQILQTKQDGATIPDRRSQIGSSEGEEYSCLRTTNKILYLTPNDLKMTSESCSVIPTRVSKMNNWHVTPTSEKSITISNGQKTGGSGVRTVFTKHETSHRQIRIREIVHNSESHIKTKR